MNTAKINVKTKDSKKIYESIIPEISSHKSERSKITIKPLNDELLLEFEAKDINALKTVMNHVLRLISACEEAAKIKGEKTDGN